MYGGRLVFHEENDVGPLGSVLVAHAVANMYLLRCEHTNTYEPAAYKVNKHGYCARSMSSLRNFESTMRSLLLADESRCVSRFSEKSWIMVDVNAVQINSPPNPLKASAMLSSSMLFKGQDSVDFVTTIPFL